MSRMTGYYRLLKGLPAGLISGDGRQHMACPVGQFFLSGLSDIQNLDSEGKVPCRPKGWLKSTSAWTGPTLSR